MVSDQIPEGPHPVAGMPARNASGRPKGMHARRNPRIVIVVVFLVLLVSCSASGEGTAPPDATPDSPTTDAPPATDATTTTQSAPPPEPPEVGDCWSALTDEEIDAIAFAGEEVDCNEPHGSVTVAVVDVDPDLESDLDGVDPDDDTVELVQSAGQVCTSEWNDVIEETDFDTEALLVSRARRATTLGFSFWLPTDDEWDAGARWVRCDLQAYDFTFDLDLDGLNALSDNPVPTELVLCLADEPGRPIPADCQSPEAQYQAIAEFQITNEAAPDDQAAYDALIDRLALSCAQLTVEAVGPVLERQYRVFAVEDFELSIGEFTCATKVTPPVTDPLGT